VRKMDYGLWNFPVKTNPQSLTHKTKQHTLTATAKATWRTRLPIILPATSSDLSFGVSALQGLSKSVDVGSPLCHAQRLVNDICPMELGKTWDPYRISRKLEIVVVRDAGS